MSKTSAKHRVFLAVALTTLFALVAGCAAAPEAPAPNEDEAAPSAPAQEVIKINMGNLWGGGHIQQVTDQFVEWCEEATDGRMQFTVLPGETAVPVEDHLEATGEGVFDLNYMYEGYYQEEIPAFQVTTGIPGTLREPADAWKINKLGGWEDLSSRIYAEHDIAFVGRIARAADAIVSTVPIPHVADLQGLKIRSEGIDAEALSSLGASTVFTPQDEVYVSLSSGLLDAAESGDATSQYDVGFYEVAKHWIQPPLQNCALGLVLNANMDFWNSLSGADRSLIDKIWHYTGEVIVHDQEYRTKSVLELVQKEHGVTVYYWDDADLKAWGEAVMSNVQQHPDDPYWVEAWTLLQDYQEAMGY